MPLGTTGRDDTLQVVRVALDDPGTSVILIAGEAGVGKSHLLGLVGAEPGLVVVDDLHRYDDHARAAALTAAREPGQTLVATVRTEAGRFPEEIAAFGYDPGVVVVVVEPFTGAEMEAFVGELLGGAVDARLSAEVCRRSGGIALFAAQLVNEARSRGVIERSASGWFLTAPLMVPVGLRQQLAVRLDGLSAAGVAAAELLAGSDALTVEAAERSGHAPGLDALSAAGVARWDQDVLRFVHPLYAEVVWEPLSPLRRRAVLREQLALEAGSAAPDPVRLAVLGLGAGEPADPGSLLVAARLANAAGNAESACRLAEAALAAGTGDQVAAAAGLLAGAQAELGLLDAATDTLLGALARTEPGPAAIVLAVTLHEVRLWGRFDQPGAAAALHAEARRYPDGAPFVTEAFAIAEADGLAYAGRAGDAVRLLDSVPAAELPPPLASMLATSRAHATTLLGRTAEAITIATGAHEQLVELLESSVPGSRSKHLVIASHALREHGRIPEAIEYAERAHALALADGIVVGRAWAALNVAAGLLQAGDLEAAATWAQRSLVAATSAGMVDCERLALGALCVCDGSRGREPDADLVERLRTLPDGVGFLLHQLPIGLAWAAYARGARATALDLLRAGQDRAAADDAVSSESWIIHERLRMGDPTRLDDRLGELATGAPLARARHLLAAGLADADAELLRSAGDAFAALGARLFAAEAYATAARAAAGRPAAALRRRAAAEAARVGSPVTPLLRGIAADPLSPRERLIAEAAAAGESNAQIATRLTLSLRTVENHLARAYAKLGIESRAQLDGSLDVRSD
ncbi:LuxR family transcriptional regulator [Nocardioides marmoriginsengisoli]|uniref:LuxR family transcriptional regulator n=1 Tax=Nocardioides marmoriginsengisoli TaxID=661483 RepID=A0A3N0CF98_9ACTN|nr:helix-turn-helix transcriptional regulator [Nocardioides marmoriginsengisoli]RNL61901.1 LuxR family transcriptional regulator [Nocardioides marmoriginsengisoli]